MILLQSLQKGGLRMFGFSFSQLSINLVITAEVSIDFFPPPKHEAKSTVPSALNVC